MSVQSITRVLMKINVFDKLAAGMSKLSQDKDHHVHHQMFCDEAVLRLPG